MANKKAKLPPGNELVRRLCTVPIRLLYVTRWYAELRMELSSYTEIDAAGIVAAVSDTIERTLEGHPVKEQVTALVPQYLDALIDDAEVCNAAKRLWGKQRTNA